VRERKRERESVTQAARQRERERERERGGKRLAMKLSLERGKFMSCRACHCVSQIIFFLLFSFFERLLK
jgi:hypothetical protein